MSYFLQALDLAPTDNIPILGRPDFALAHEYSTYQAYFDDVCRVVDFLGFDATWIHLPRQNSLLPIMVDRDNPLSLFGFPLEKNQSTVWNYQRMVTAKPDPRALEEMVVVLKQSSRPACLGFLVSSPFSMIASCRGLTEFYADLALNPEMIEEIIEIMSEKIIQLILALKPYFQFLILFDVMASNSFISAAYYERFCAGYINSIAQRVGLPIILWMSGRNIDSLPAVIQTEVRALYPINYSDFVNDALKHYGQICYVVSMNPDFALINKDQFWGRTKTYQSVWQRSQHGLIYHFIAPQEIKVDVRLVKEVLELIKRFPAA